MADGTDAAGLACPKDATTTSRLLKLPAELRNAIYKLVAIEPKPIRILSSRGSVSVPPPALSRVCRQLRSEVTPIYWGSNIFQLPICCCELCMPGMRSHIEATLCECMTKSGGHLTRVLLPPQNGMQDRIEVRQIFANKGWIFEKGVQGEDDSEVYGYWFVEQ